MSQITVPAWEWGALQKERDELASKLDSAQREAGEYSSKYHSALADLSILGKKLDVALLQNCVLREMVQRGLCEIGGWRELIAMWDDVAKSGPVGSAMWAALDQMDRWRSDARKVIEGTEKQVGLCEHCGATQKFYVTDWLCPKCNGMCG